MEANLIKLRAKQKEIFWICLIGYIGYYLCRKNIAAAFPLLSETFGYTNTELGLIAFYSEIAYAFGKAINGPLADRWGGKNLFALGMVGAVVFNILFVFGESLTYFIIVWCFCRYFLSMGWGGLIKLIGNWYESERNGTVMGFISLSFQFGGVLATTLAGVIIYMGFGWKAVFIVPAGMLSLIFLWCIKRTKENPGQLVPGTSFAQDSKPLSKALVSKSSMEKLKGLVKLPLFRQIVVFSFITTFLRSIFFFWTPKLLIDLGLGVSGAIFKSALFPFLGCFGTILLGWYTDKYAVNGNRAKAIWIMLSGLVLSLASITYCIDVGGLNSLIVVLLGFCGFFLLGPYSMSSGCLTLDIAGAESAGTATGIIDALGYVGGAIAVWGAGFLSDRLGWYGVFWLLTVSSFLAMCSAIMMSGEFKRLAKNKVKT